MRLYACEGGTVAQWYELLLRDEFRAPRGDDDTKQVLAIVKSRLLMCTQHLLRPGRGESRMAHVLAAWPTSVINSFKYATISLLCSPSTSSNLHMKSKAGRCEKRKAETRRRIMVWKNVLKTITLMLFSRRLGDQIYKFTTISINGCKHWAPKGLSTSNEISERRFPRRRLSEKGVRVSNRVKADIHHDVSTTKVSIAIFMSTWRRELLSPKWRGINPSETLL